MIRQIRHQVCAAFCAACGFVFAAFADLPSGYEAVTGIVSTEGNQQAILTDYVPSSSDVTIEATVALTKYSTQAIWCSRNGGTDRTMTLFVWAASNYFRLDRYNSTGVYAGKAAPLNKKTVLKADYKACQFFINGEDCGNSMQSGDFTPASKLGFFASHSNGGGFGNWAVMTLYGVKVYNADGTLEREYVPARCVANAGKTTEYGLYETQEGKYFSVTSAAKEAFGVATGATCDWTEDAANDAWVATVNGYYDLTAEEAAKLAANTHANFVKRGPGTLTGTPIQDFTGNITVAEGTFRVAHRYDVGADNTGWIRVLDGASLEFNGFAGENAPRALTGKTVYTTGSGVGGKGVICGGVGWNSCSACSFILEGDSFYQMSGEFNFINTIDLAGYKLTGKQTTTWMRWGISATQIKNTSDRKATFEIIGGMFRPETMSTFGSAEDTNGEVIIRSATEWGLEGVPTEGFQSYWPVTIGPNVRYSARKATNHANYNSGVISGPLTFTGNIRLGSYVQDGVNGMANVKGTLTGDGTTEIGSGWVNFHTKVNDYAGDVTVARDPTLASEDYRAGIKVMDGAVYSAKKTTLENGDFELSAGTTEVKSDLFFTGDAESRLTGGNPVGARTTLARVHKDGAGTLLLAAGAVIERLDVVDGTVRLPTGVPVYGKPGLMGSETNVTCWVFNSPTSANVPCVYDTNYLHGNDLTSSYEPHATGARTTMVKGYIWNRSGETQNWTFRAHHTDRVWLWIDDETIFSNQVGYGADPANAIKTLTITPGPHKYVLATTSSNTSAGQNYVNWNSARGSLYDACPIDFQGRGSSDLSTYSEARDPGDGSLFTVDDKTTEELAEGEAFWLPMVETLVAAPGTTLDAVGFNYAVKTLEGALTVTNVKTFTVEEGLKLDSASLAARACLTVNGTLVCGEGAEIGLASSWETLTMAELAALDEGVTIATAETLSGTPKLSAELVSHKAVLGLSADGKSLTLRVPSDRYVKVVGEQVKIAYAAPMGKPNKEARIDIYRDGVLVKQTFVGEGHGKNVMNYTSTEDGYYFAVATVVREDGSESRTVFGEVTKGAGIVLSENCGKTIIEAIDELGEDGGKIYLEPGTYVVENLHTGALIRASIQVIGKTTDPASVIVTRNPSVNNRLFTLQHPEAAVRFMTLQDGQTARITTNDGWEIYGSNGYIDGCGGNVLIYPEGGTIENCIIKNGSTLKQWEGAGGNVAMMAGRLTNCTLIGGLVQMSAITTWIQYGTSLMIHQNKATSNVLVENCLITGCTAQNNNGVAPVAIFANQNTKMVNCTITGNEGVATGGVFLWKIAHKSTDTCPQLINCAIFGNRQRTTEPDERAAVYALVPNFRGKDNTVSDEDMVAGVFVKCASAIQLNETCLKTDDPKFVDAANGDFSLQADSPLVNAGCPTATVEGLSKVDLVGSPRSVKGTDIGCYEYREPKFRNPGTVIVIR